MQRALGWNKNSISLHNKAAINHIRGLLLPTPVLRVYI